MSKLSMDEKDRIIKRDLPGYKIVEESSGEDAGGSVEQSKPQPEASTPTIKELRRKYFGSADEWRNHADSNPSESSGNSNDDDEIVVVQPENKADALDRGWRAKSVVISNGEVTGSQG
jgi:hypothetical protein